MGACNVGGWPKQTEEAFIGLLSRRVSFCEHTIYRIEYKEVLSCVDTYLTGYVLSSPAPIPTYLQQQIYMCTHMFVFDVRTYVSMYIEGLFFYTPAIIIITITITIITYYLLLTTTLGNT